MRSIRRPILATIAGLVASGLLLVSMAGPALAKEGVEALLDAPIGRDTPAGTELLVGMQVFALDGDTTHPVEGTPMYLELTGPTGDVTRAMGVQGNQIGHYTMRITVPAGGIASLEVGIHGTSDLAITVIGNPLIGGGIGPRTAQAAPAVKAPDAAPADDPATASTGEPTPAAPPMVVVVLALALAALAIAGLAFGWRLARGPRGLVSPPRAPGA